MARKKVAKKRAEHRDGAAVEFSKHAWDEFNSWKSDAVRFKKLCDLIDECMRTPFQGIGKPEPLKEPLSGWWSRRITGEHRLIYRFERGVLIIAQCRYHY